MAPRITGKCSQTFELVTGLVVWKIYVPGCNIDYFFCPRVYEPIKLFAPAELFL
jgi:hypothetical protein